MALFNRTVLMSGAAFFNDTYAINAHMDAAVPVNVPQAAAELASIKLALEQAGTKVIQVSPPEYCQDGVYTANWALCRGESAVMSSLPNVRKKEEPYAEKVLIDLGKRIIKVPEGLKFSGQGDALPCGDLLFVGSEYRTDKKVHEFLSKTLGYWVIGLQTRPKRRLFGWGPRVINRQTGWPDSYYYDLDLALAILKPPAEGQKGLIAWCPEAFTRSSRRLLRELNDVDKIEVSRHEATKGLGCNLVSTGETVIMSAKAPELQAAIEERGLKTIVINAPELAKGGGYIRCTTLTLDNV